MDVLVALGSSAAYGYSVVTVAVAVSYGEEGGGQACFETASMLITFILLGKYLEASAKRKTSEALSKLVSLVPPTALLCPPGSLPGAGGDDGDEAARSVPVADLRTGDVVQVPPGAQLPVDGEVVHGSSEVNEHMVTGEPVPVPKAEGAQVIGGTLNCSGALWVRVGAVGNETVLAKIMKVVSDAQMRRPDVQAFADRISSVFVPAVRPSPTASRPSSCRRLSRSPSSRGRAGRPSSRSSCCPTCRCTDGTAPRRSPSCLAAPCSSSPARARWGSPRPPP